MNFYLLCAIKAAVVAGALMTALAYLQWVERKVIAHIQVRMGPYRVGPHGLLQPLADVIKLLTKEDLLPPGVNRFYFVLAPFLAISLALISICVIPFGPEIHAGPVYTWMQLTDLNIGVIFVLAISSLSVYAVVLAGWASNSKYPLLGSLRSAAQMISYELPMGMAVAGALLVSNTLSLRGIVETQSQYYWGWIPAWNVFHGPFPQIFGFAIFLITIFAETNRVPFDLAEAESELVAGFHTEYSSLKFAGFFMAEYANMVTVCAMATVLYLGGWMPPFPARYGSNFVPGIVFAIAGAVAIYHGLHPARKRDRLTLPAFGAIFLGIAALFCVPLFQPILTPLFWFLAKTGFLLFTFMWVRGTLPRFRYDQLMRFAWRFLFPAAALNLLVTALLVALVG
ncbi:MAG: complex I subunit 1 family protein [Bryobacteraceae bacterium]